MKIKKLELDNFMIFNHLDVEFSPDINIISGENSTGKTALIKILYSCMKGYSNACWSKNDVTKDRIEDMLVNKIQGVFRLDKDAIGRLVNRKQGSNRADIKINFDDDTKLHVGFGNRQEKHIDILNNDVLDMKKINLGYIPPKEIISSTENFVSLYADYRIAFEETYYDLARLLECPLKRGANTAEQNRVMKSFEKIVQGSITQKDKNFYLKVPGAGEFEMGLVSEGYRKLSTIMYLIASGTLTKDAVLFLAEPETNMNPKMIKPVVDAIIELSKMGVQVFVTTHDYFVQQCFNLAATYSNYSKDEKRKLDYQFISLYKDQSEIKSEYFPYLHDLEHNAVIEEFDQLYDREQELLNDN